MNFIELAMVAMLPLYILSETDSEDGILTGKQKGYKFEVEIVKKVQINYLLFLPKDYSSDPEKKFPMILFLHGAGERGDNLELLKVHGIPKIIEKDENFPFITVSPQCPSESWWTMESEALEALLNDIINKYKVDVDRIYLTGLSMGGYGTWSLAIKNPNTFAAIAPICGGGDPKKVCAIKDVPAWVFHGAKDEIVPLQQSENMVKALKECGGDVKFTVYPEAGHDSWTATYDNPELYEWFLKHSRSKK
ncbi:MAG: prolyl oligopeptidase family serine peptidase [bacterium]